MVAMHSMRRDILLHHTLYVQRVQSVQRLLQGVPPLSFIEAINCMTVEEVRGCGRCMTCRIIHALENLTIEVDSDQLARHVDRIGDELGVISEYVERL